MSRSRRGTGDPLSSAHTEPAGAAKPGPHHPTAAPVVRTQRGAKAAAKVHSDVLTKLRGAVSRSQAKTKAEDSDDAEFERNTQAAIAQAHVPGLPTADAYALMCSEPSEEQALEFAKLLRAGVPQPDALCYVLGSVEPGVIEMALPRWMRARRVVDALATLNGGRWPSLEPDARLDIALDKHYAEMAHYLYTHDYETADGPTLKKLDTARASLETLRTGRLEQNSPFVKFLRSILGAKANVPTLPAAGETMGDGYRAPTLGLVEIVDAEVTETGEEA